MFITIRYLIFYLVIAVLYPAKALSQSNDSTKVHFQLGTAGMLAFSGLNADITGEVSFKRHTVYIGPKISVSDAYLPSTAVLGFVAGYKYFFLENRDEPGKFNFFFELDYQLQHHKAYRANTSLPERYNSLHELNAGYGLQFAISKRLAINNVLAFGRYLEVFRNPKSGTETKFDGYNRMLRVQVIYTLR